jgi:hypothetical protein
VGSRKDKYLLTAKTQQFNYVILEGSSLVLDETKKKSGKIFPV